MKKYKITVKKLVVDNKKVKIKKETHKTIFWYGSKYCNNKNKVIELIIKIINNNIINNLFFIKWFYKVSFILIFSIFIHFQFFNSVKIALTIYLLLSSCLIFHFCIQVKNLFSTLL